MDRIIRAIYKFLRIIVPWLWRIFIFSIKTVALSLGSWFISIPRIVRTVARDWSNRAEVAGVPSEYDRVLFYGAGVIALLMVVLGWIFSAFLTVWLIGFMF
jgi:hypothetical protein